MNKGIILLAMMISTTLTAASPMPWLVMYGKDLTPAQLSGVAIAVVEPGHITPKTQFPGSPTRFFGYVSVGEVNENRPYWPAIRGSQWVLAQNPNWPGAHGVDVRAPAWRTLLLETVIPVLVQNGFSGVFLDTIDEAMDREDSDPRKFHGARKATIQLIRSIKTQFPTLGILPNNGLTILMDIGSIVDGVVVEELYTQYNFKKKTSAAAPAVEDREREKVLDAFTKKFKKPVFVILYGDPASDLVKRSIARCQAKGYHWYVADVSLTTVGTMEGK